MDVTGVLDYLVGFAIMAGIYAVFALGLNVHWGFTGLFNIGIAGFFALGAYTAALMTTQPPDPELFEDFKFGGNWSELGYLDWGIDLWFFLGLGAAAAVCGAIALAIGYVTLRLRDDYLAIATLGIAETVRLFFLNEKWAANGSKGLVPDTQVLGRLVAVTALRLPLFGRGRGHPGRPFHCGGAGHQISVGASAARDSRGRGGRCGQRQERLQIQAPSVHPGSGHHGDWRSVVRPTTSGSSRPRPSTRCWRRSSYGPC